MAVTLFSAPEPKAQVHYCDHALSVVRPSSVVVTFSHFRLLLWNRWTVFNETWLEARYQRPLQSLCFSGRLEKQDGRPGLWLAETFSTSPLKPLNGIQWNLTGSKISTSSTKFVFFRTIGKTRWPPWPLIGWDIFDFSSETTERNSTKLDRKQDQNVLYQVCVFRADLKNKMAALVSDWLRHFRFLLWNHWREFEETWQEARSQHPLPNLYFSGRSEKENGRPGLWLTETFSTSPLKPLNGIQRNLTGRKISTSSTKFVFLGRSEKQKRWPPWPIRQTHCTQVHDMLPFGPLAFVSHSYVLQATQAFLGMLPFWLQQILLARLHFSAEELLLYPWRRRQRPCRRRRQRPRRRVHAKC